MRISRRAALQGVAAWTLSRADAQVTPDITRFHPELEPLVDLIERTPRERCADVLVEQFRSGVSYRQAMAALFLAGIRNINPQPPGFALHCVFVVHSAHLIGLEAPADLRLLPFFYALDNFKTAQERDRTQGSGDYTMRPLRGTLPTGDRAPMEFASALEAWDVERAERAMAAIVRHRSAAEAFELLWLSGARDYRNIGHKAIFVANVHRTLQAIGWQHAEPVLRSLTRGLLAFAPDQEVNGYKLHDQCYAHNIELASKTSKAIESLSADRPSTAANVRALCATLRDASPAAACTELAGRLASGRCGAADAWDAVHLSAAELRMRTGAGGAIVGLHAVTSANALHHAYASASTGRLRLLLLLQAAGWMAQFRTWASSRDKAMRSLLIVELEPHAEPADVATVLSRPETEVDFAAAEALALARVAENRQALLAGALRATIPKANEVHYYKYLAALIEDMPLGARHRNQDLNP
jgi:hypothetical protein